MRINDLKFELTGWRSARASWTGTGDALVHVFVNGSLDREPFRLAGTEKGIDLSPPDPFILEVHETTDEEESVKAASIPLERRPLVWWSSRDGTVLYRVYFRPGPGVEQLIGAVSHDAAMRHHECRTAQDLRRDDGTWAFLRVEAVNAQGQESTRSEWPLFVAGLPAKPSGLNVTGGSGVFDFALEV